MGVTPDDIVQCECCGVGVIEVKCPFYVSRKAFTQMLLRIIVFLHHNGEGTLTLKENHAYLYQAQMQMRFAAPQYCDFIVWKKGSYL